jgi:hypothetical protein
VARRIDPHLPADRRPAAVLDQHRLEQPGRDRAHRFLPDRGQAVQRGQLAPGAFEPGAAVAGRGRSPAVECDRAECAAEGEFGGVAIKGRGLEFVHRQRPVLGQPVVPGFHAPGAAEFAVVDARRLEAGGCVVVDRRAPHRAQVSS